MSVKLILIKCHFLIEVFVNNQYAVQLEQQAEPTEPLEPLRTDNNAN